jgi:hypothetical protein
MKNSDDRIQYLPIGIVPNWLLKAETGKDFWEHLISDAELRESVLERINGRLRWKKGELFYERI